MGLDMYARTLRADLAPDQQTDVDVLGIALGAADPDLADSVALEARYTAAAHNAELRALLTAQVTAAREKLRTEGIADMEFAYWRKFNHLHGWMEQLYREKGGQSECFNLVTVRVDRPDLDKLETQASQLSPKSGFFFGDTRPMERDDVEAILQFVRQAREAIDKGHAVFYDSWW